MPYSTLTDQQRVARLSHSVLHLMQVIDELQVVWLACQRASDAEDWDDLRRQLHHAETVFDRFWAD